MEVSPDDHETDHVDDHSEENAESECGEDDPMVEPEPEEGHVTQRALYFQEVGLMHTYWLSRNSSCIC